MGWKKKLAAGTALAALTAGVIYAINKSIYFMATLNDFLSKPKGTFYKWRFGDIFYTKKGSGKPILLVHDLTAASSGYEWSKIEETLSHTNTVYTIDLLGCGRSDKPNLTYTNYLYVQLITDFIKTIIGKRTDVIATGDSCPLVLMACCNDKTIMNHILLTNPTDLSTLAIIPSKRSRFLKSFINIPIIGTLLYNIFMTKSSTERLFRNKYFYDPTRVEQQYLNVYYEAAHSGNTKSKYLFSSIKGRYTNANINHCLKKLNNSIFIIFGSGTIENKRTAERYKALTPSIELFSINKTKHLPQLEDPGAYLEHIKVALEIEE